MEHKVRNLFTGPNHTSDATRCTRRRAVLASLVCAQSRLLTPSALREQHASAAKTVPEQGAQNSPNNDKSRQRFSCLTRGSQSCLLALRVRVRPGGSSGAQARVCSSKHGGETRQKLHPRSLVPRFLGSPPAALSMDRSAAPARVLFPVLAEASQNGSFAGTSSNSVEVWSAKPVAAVCGDHDAATRVEDFELWSPTEWEPGACTPVRARAQRG